MSTRSIYIAFIFNLFSFQGICQGNEQTQDSLIIQYQDTLKKQNIFHRIYKYFRNQTKRQKKKNSIFPSSEVRTLPVT